MCLLTRKLHKTTEFIDSFSLKCSNENSDSFKTDSAAAQDANRQIRNHFLQLKAFYLQNTKTQACLWRQLSPQSER